MTCRKVVSISLLVFIPPKKKRGERERESGKLREIENLAKRRWRRCRSRAGGRASASFHASDALTRISGPLGRVCAVQNWATMPHVGHDTCETTSDPRPRLVQNDAVHRLLPCWARVLKEEASNGCNFGLRFRSSRFEIRARVPTTSFPFFFFRDYDKTRLVTSGRCRRLSSPSFCGYFPR